MCQLVDFVHNFVNINAFRIGVLFIIAISASVQQDFVLLVFFRIQHVVARDLEILLIVAKCFIAYHS